MRGFARRPSESWGLGQLVRTLGLRLQLALG